MDLFREFVLTISVSFLSGLITYVIAGRILPWFKDCTYYLAKIQGSSARRWSRLFDGLLSASAAGYVVVLIVHVTLLQHNNGGGPDVALFNQVLWNSARGRLFETSLLANTTSQLGNHFSPLLLAVTPLYVLVDAPIALMVAQALAVVGTVFPLYWFAQPRIGQALAFVIAIAFLLFPSIHSINLYGFHEIPLATMPLALALYFLLHRRDLPFWACTFVALLAKEDVSFIVVGFGLFILLVQRRYRLGLSVVMVGLIWAVVVLQFVMPSFVPSGMRLIGFLYPAFGNSLSEMVVAILTHPIFVAEYVLAPEKIAFVLHLLVPLIFAPLIGLEVTGLALIPLLELLLSAYEGLYAISNYYSSPLLPFLFFGAVVGLQRVLGWGIPPEVAHPSHSFSTVARKTALAVAILAASLTSYYLYSAGPLARRFNLAYLIPNAHTELGNVLMQEIPADAVVAAQNEFVSQMSSRRQIYTFPTFPDYRQIDYLFGDTTRFWYDFHEGAWDNVLASGYFEIVTQQDGYIFSKRRPLDHSLQVQFGDQISLLGYTIIATDTLRGGEALCPILGWRAEREIPQRYRFLLSLVDQQGHVWAEDDREPQDGILPTDRWNVGKFVGDQYTLFLPSTMPPGDYQIRISIYDPASEHRLIVRDATGQRLGDEVAITTRHIDKDKSSITASQLLSRQQLEQPYFVDMGEIRLLGFKPMPQAVMPGEVLQVGIYWRARGKPLGDYLVAVQLRDAGGRVVAEQWSRPAGGTYPTTEWDAGEVLLDWHDLRLPPSLPSGNYAVYVMLTDSPGGTILGEAALPLLSVMTP